MSSNNIDVPYTCYIAECGDLTYYTGIARYPEIRIEVHNQGRGSKYVANRLPCWLVFKSEQFPNRSIAQQVEHAIKKLNRKDKDKLIDSMFNRLKYPDTLLDTYMIKEIGRQALQEVGLTSEIVDRI